MKWLKRITIVIGGTLMLFGFVVAVGYLYLVNQVEKKLLQQGISEPNWQVSTIENSQIIFKQISFNYQNRYQVSVKNLTINSMYGFDKALQKQPINSVAIERLSIRQKAEAPAPVKNKSVDIPKLIKQLQQQIKQLQQPSFNLALLPHKLYIKEVTYQQPCAIQTCALSASLNSVLSATAEHVVLENQFSLADNTIPELKLSNQLDISLPTSNSPDTLQVKLSSSINKINNSEDKLISLQFFSSLEQPTDKTQFVKLNINASGDLPKLEYSNKGDASLTQEWQALATLYRNWSGQTLMRQELVDYLEKVKLQSNSLSASRDFSLNSSHRIDLNSIKSLERPLESIDLQSQLSLQLSKPLFIPKLAWLQGSISTDLKLLAGKVQNYQLESQGKLDQLQTPESLKQQGWQLNAVDFKLASKSPAESTADHLTEIPLQLELETAGNKVESISINALGKLALEPMLLNIDSGKLKVFKRKLQTGKQHLSHLNTTLEFKADIATEKSKIQIDSVKGSATLLFGKSRVRVKRFNAKNLSIAFASIKQPFNTLQLKTDRLTVSSDIKTPELTVKNHLLTLNKANLKPIYKTKQQSPTGYLLQAQYKDSLKQLDHTAVKPMSWRSFGKGKIWFSQSFKVARAKVQGSISNHAGLVTFHNTTYTPKAISSEWEIPNIYFLAGNSLEKTLRSWPKLLTIGSGKLHAKGKFDLPLSSRIAQKPLLEGLSLHSQIEASGLSGIYNETTLNQLDLKSTVSLKNSALDTNIELLKLEQVNHGVIAGPIYFSGRYKSKFAQFAKGKLTIKKAKVNLFEGQASLPAQKIDLAKPFSSQLDLEAINLQALLQQYPSADIKGTGLVSGKLPFSVNLTNKPFITIQQGHLHAKKPGGTLRYQPSSTGLKQTHQSMKLVLNVLEDFHYQVLSSDVSFGADKKLHLKLRLQGNNPSVENGRQVNFNIQLEEDLPALITSMQISNQVSETIKNRIQQKLQKKQ